MCDSLFSLKKSNLISWYRERKTKIKIKHQKDEVYKEWVPIHNLVFSYCRNMEIDVIKFAKKNLETSPTISEEEKQEILEMISLDCFKVQQYITRELSILKMILSK